MPPRCPSSCCKFGGAAATRSSPASFGACSHLAALVARLDIPVLFLVIQVLIVYGNGIAALLFERSLQPVLDDLAAALSEEVDVEAAGLSLNRRLLLALPAMNVGVGVLVAGLSNPATPESGQWRSPL